MGERSDKELIDRLNGIYRIPITDGYGAVGGGEEPDNPNEFVRKFETNPIQREAADRISSLIEERDRLREEEQRLRKLALDYQAHYIAMQAVLKQIANLDYKRAATNGAAYTACQLASTAIATAIRESGGET